MIRILRVAAVSVTLLFVPWNAGATNGMNMEGYGAVACGMGGTSFAFDNGTAAMMNNPATLSFFRPGTRRLDLSIGMLGPRVDATVSTPGGEFTAESLSDAFFMPAGGFVARTRKLSFGLGVFAQGGMGTEYSSTSWMSDPSGGSNTALAEGLTNRTEISVGRVIAPVAWDLGKLSLGGSLDYVWAGMDLQMAMSEAQFVDLATTRRGGTADGSLLQGFGRMYEPFGGTGVQTVHHAYFNFSDDSAFTGSAKGDGIAGKVGATYRFSPRWTVGATYHSKTNLGDLDASGTTMQMGVSIDTGIAQGQAPTGTYMDANMDVTGTIAVRNFQWPASYGAGTAFRPSERFLIAVDVQRIGWKSVMKDFSMTFTADDNPLNGGFAGTTLDATLYQDWDDQNVLHAGFEWAVSPRVDLRTGFNVSNNPVPDETLNPLFPAIVQDHVSFGAGWGFARATRMDLSVMHAFRNEATNPNVQVTSGHSQWNLGLLVSHDF